MLCPSCLSSQAEPDSKSDSPAGPLFCLVVLHFECRGCGHKFYRANPELARSRVRLKDQFFQRRGAA